MNPSDVRSETSLMLTIAIIALVTVATIVTYVKRTCSTASPVLLETLPMLREQGSSSGGLEAVSLDRAEVALPVHHVLRMQTPGSLVLRGWAADPIARRPAAGVFAVVDNGRAFRASYEPNAAGNFSVALQSSEIGGGAHSLELRVVPAGRNGYYRLTPVLNVVVR